MAHKKAAWSAKNLTTSRAKYRGVKLFGGQTTTAGNVIIRQKGDVYQLGHNVYKGRDFTIHASIDGVVTFRKKNITRFDGNVYLKTVVDVVTAEEYKAMRAWASSSVKWTAVKAKATSKATKPVTVSKDDDSSEEKAVKVPVKKAPAKKPTAKETTKTVTKAKKEV